MTTRFSTRYVSLMKASEVDKIFNIYAKWYIVKEGTIKSSGNENPYYSTQELREILGDQHMRRLECEVVTSVIDAELVEFHPVQK